MHKKTLFILFVVAAFLTGAILTVVSRGATIVSAQEEPSDSPSDSPTDSPSDTPSESATPSATPQPSNYPLTGWAWSSNIGWISFSSANPGAMGPTDKDYAGLIKVAHAAGTYGVYLQSSTGLLTGYAWSPSIGWIKFGGLSSMPSGGTNAQVNLNTGRVSGFIRACGGTASGNCSSMTSRTDGWDGWIELSGVNHVSPDPSNPNGPSGQGVFMSPTGAFSGYAWGPLVSWFSFDAVTCLNCTTGTAVTGTCQISANGSTWSNSTISLVAGNPVYLRVVGVSGGTAPYTYAWSPIGSGYVPDPATSLSSLTYTIPVVTPAGLYQVMAKVSDSAARVTNLTCGSISLTQPSVPFRIAIGPTVSKATKSLQQITRGSGFGLDWKNQYGTNPDYTCNETNISKDGVAGAGNTYWPTWASLAKAGDNSLSVVNTTNVPVGTYVFTIKCAKASVPVDYPNPVSATLKIVGSGGGEQ